MTLACALASHRACRAVLGTFALVSALAAAPSSVAAPSAVLVKSREQGQGLLFRRADTCYLLTAGHVVGDATAAGVVGSSGLRLLGEARLVAHFKLQDLALLRVSGGIAQDCGEDLGQYRQDLSRFLAQRQNGSLPFVFDTAEGGKAGGLGRLPVVVTDVGADWVRIAPVRASDGIEQGRSGTVVVVPDGSGDRAVGILLSVEDGGTGKTLRLDRAVALIDRFFSSPRDVPGLAAPPSPPVVAGGSAADRPGNFLAAAAGAQVVAFTVLPGAPEFAAANLLDSRSPHPWVAPMTSKPLQVDLRLAGDGAQTVSRVEFVRATSQDAATAAREIEIFASMDGSSWRSVHRGTLFNDEAVKVAHLAPIRATHLRLRIYQNWGDPQWVSLRQIRAY